MELGLIGLEKMGFNVSGRWTLFEAPVITGARIGRIRSREENNFSDRMLAIMRNAFGGHAVKKA